MVRQESVAQVAATPETGDDPDREVGPIPTMLAALCVYLASD